MCQGREGGVWGDRNPPPHLCPHCSQVPRAVSTDNAVRRPSVRLLPSPPSLPPPRALRRPPRPAPCSRKRCPAPRTAAGHGVSPVRDARPGTSLKDRFTFFPTKGRSSGDVPFPGQLTSVGGQLPSVRSQLTSAGGTSVLGQVRVFFLPFGGGLLAASQTHSLIPLRTPPRTARRTAHGGDPRPTPRMPTSLGTQPPRVGT